VADVLIPYRHVPSLWPNRPATLPMLDICDDASTTCTGLDGDQDDKLCLCHWAPWFDGSGRPADGPDPDYEPLIGDPFADIPAAKPWTPRARMARTSERPLDQLRVR
jgi:hypothetical protein